MILFIVPLFSAMCVYVAGDDAGSGRVLEALGWAGVSILFPALLLGIAHLASWSVRRASRELDRRHVGKDVARFSNGALARHDRSTLRVGSGVITGNADAIEIWEALDPPRLVLRVDRAEFAQARPISILPGLSTAMLRIITRDGGYFECQPIFGDVRDVLAVSSRRVRRIVDELSAEYDRLS